MSSVARKAARIYNDLVAKHPELLDLSEKAVRAARELVDAALQVKKRLAEYLDKPFFDDPKLRTLLEELVREVVSQVSQAYTNLRAQGYERDEALAMTLTMLFSPAFLAEWEQNLQDTVDAIELVEALKSARG